MSEPSERALRCELPFSKYTPLIAYHFVLLCERYFFEFGSTSPGSASCAFRMLYLCKSSGSLRYLPIYLLHSSILEFAFMYSMEMIAVAGAGTYFPVTQLLASVVDGWDGMVRERMTGMWKRGERLREIGFDKLFLIA